MLKDFSMFDTKLLSPVAASATEQLITKRTNAMKKTIATLLACLFLVACSDSSEKIVGAWKSKEIGTISGKPKCFIFSKDTVSTDGGSFKANFFEEDGVILVKNVGSNDTIFIVTPQKDPKEIRIESPNVGDQLYIKTTPDDVAQIRATPIELTPNPDPF